MRIQIALSQYKERKHPFKEDILKEYNETIRNILLTKGHLIPNDLLEHAADLVAHYDKWLQAYHLLRVETDNEENRWVFVGGFPKQAEIEFNKKYNSYRKDLKIEELLN